MVDKIPIISQVKSFFQAIFGDTDGAKETQENFSKQCPIVSQARSAVEALMGDRKAAEETQKEFLKSTVSHLDGIPVIGHIKGAIHYIADDKEGGDNSMKAASRTIGVVGVGAVGFLAGGPVGAVAGGIAGGACMDSYITSFDSAINWKGKEIRTYGYFKQIEDIIKNPKKPGTYFDTAVMIGMDGLSGHAAGKSVADVNKFINKRAVRKTFEKERRPIEMKVTKASAKDLVKAADEMKSLRETNSAVVKKPHVTSSARNLASNDIFFGEKKNVFQKKPHVTSIVRNLEDGKVFTGHNKQMRNACKIPELNFANKPSLLEQKLPNVKPPLKRASATCAENYAYEQLYMKNMDINPLKTRVATVRYDIFTDKIVGAERCGNCYSLRAAMGEAPGDIVKNEVIPNHPGIGKYNYYREMRPAAENVAMTGSMQLQL